MLPIFGVTKLKSHSACLSRINLSIFIKKPVTRQPVKSLRLNPDDASGNPGHPAESLPIQPTETLDNQPANTLSSPPEPLRASYSEIVQLNLPSSPHSSHQTVSPTTQRANTQVLQQNVVPSSQPTLTSSEDGHRVSSPQTPPTRSDPTRSKLIPSPPLEVAKKQTKKRKRHKHPDSPEGNPAPSLRREPVSSALSSQGLTNTPKTTIPSKRYAFVNPRTPVSAGPQDGEGSKRKRPINKDQWFHS